MMESAIREIHNKVGKSNEPLSVRLSIDLSLLLNAYYLNLTGSLDNLAWALTYHHNLIDSIDEDDSNQYRFVQLTGTKFIRKLRKENLQELADKLSSMDKWCKSVKKFRNPAAHNIPLYVPPSVLSGDDLDKHKELNSKAAELIKDEKDYEGASLIYEAFRLGKHYPIFITELPQIEIYELPKNINEDHENWLKVTQTVFQFGFGANYL